MSYDIPDEIKYKEKIVFNLDLKQLCYACGFGFLALMSMNLPLPSDFKVVPAIFFAILGACFILLNLEEKLADLLDYHRNVKDADSSNPKAKALVGVSRITGNALVLTSGGLRSVLRVSPVNFSLLEDSQKEALINGYREFLNHLDTPVQVLVKTTRASLQDYFKEAQDKIGDSPEQLVGLFKGFRAFETGFLKQNRVRERTFYLIVSQSPKPKLFGKHEPEDEEFKQLSQKTQIIQEKLLACGIKTTLLKAKELQSMLEAYAPKSDQKCKTKRKRKSKPKKEAKKRQNQKKAKSKKKQKSKASSPKCRTRFNRS